MSLLVRTFIIAGASSGIGLALAKRLLDAGHRVHGVSRTPGPLQDRQGYTHYAVDLLQEYSLPVVIGPIHGLAFCPGSIMLKPVERLTTADVDRDFTLNAKAAFLFVRQYLPQLRESGSASVVLFSTVAVQTGMPFHASVAMAKGAVEGLSRALAAELAPAIRVNAIAPSLTDTPLASGLLNTEAKVEAAKLRHPLRTVGSVDEHASLAYYLLTDSTWITGQVIGVNGGLGSIIK
ncbi:SDR family oxidoreductase [Terrimonas sp. NA20]|uniref:SDR family oxidoreductase n=1 Tax=Terrimonas ginsenosidimutans TaxID=2908004 RepID=A0ABS9KVI8_9BACT|nr:SDR family oxidoreductase [Terrimonas ginsenosidimutans]MCG2616254.1 SDR family oxidoreductase [Terrimonas ginsenosidimutans]